MSEDVDQGHWPVCGKCDKRITVHYPVGHKMTCDEGKTTVGDFTIKEVNDLRHALGLTVSDSANQKEIAAELAKGKT